MTTWTPFTAVTLIVAGLCLLTAGGAVFLAWRYYHNLDVSRREHRMADEARQYWIGREHDAKQDVHLLTARIEALTKESDVWKRSYEQTASALDQLSSAPDTVDEGAPA